MTVTMLTTPEVPAELALPYGRWHGPLWLSDDPLSTSDSYARCVAAYDRTGWWPVLVPVGDLAALARDAILPAPRQRVEEIDPAVTLARWWQAPRRTGVARHRPSPVFPGLAPPSTGRADPQAEAGNTGTVLTLSRDHHLGLIRTGRPADAPALIGWAGSGQARTAAVSAVLRSWEDRFGAVLVRLGADSLDLAVSAPPRSLDHANAVAAEHHAFCPADGRQALPDLASGLVGARLWDFRWK